MCHGLDALERVAPMVTSVRRRLITLGRHRDWNMALAGRDMNEEPWASVALNPPILRDDLQHKWLGRYTDKWTIKRGYGGFSATWKNELSVSSPMFQKDRF